MTSDKIIKGAAIGAGAALLYLYFKNRKNKSASKISGTANGKSTLKDMSSEKLAELKDNIEDILAEREA